MQRHLIRCHYPDNISKDLMVILGVKEVLAIGGASGWHIRHQAQLQFISVINSLINRPRTLCSLSYTEVWPTGKHTTPKTAGTSKVIICSSAPHLLVNLEIYPHPHADVGFITIHLTSAVLVQNVPGWNSIAACSFLENCSFKQLHTWHCTFLGPQQYTPSRVKSIGWTVDNQRTDRQRLLPF